MGGGGQGSEARCRRPLSPKGSFPSALQASQVPALPREEDLGDEDDEDEDEDDDEEEDFLTAGSQVSCPVVWSSGNQAAFPQGAGPLLSWRPLQAGQQHFGPQAQAVSWAAAAGSSGRLQPPSHGMWFHSPGAHPSQATAMSWSCSPPPTHLHCAVPSEAWLSPKGVLCPLPGVLATC